MESTPFRTILSSRHIRILRLLPSLSFDSPILYNLEEISLENDGSDIIEYTALSYVWGTPQNHPVGCDGSSILVTRNCADALRHLRSRTTEVVLWVDSICINQASISEKNIQVPLMGEIYSRAKDVFIWLGHGGEATERALMNLQNRCSGMMSSDTSISQWKHAGLSLLFDIAGECNLSALLPSLLSRNVDKPGFL